MFASGCSCLAFSAAMSASSASIAIAWAPSRSLMPTVNSLAMTASDWENTSDTTDYHETQARFELATSQIRQLLAPRGSARPPFERRTSRKDFDQAKDCGPSPMEVKTFKWLRGALRRLNRGSVPVGPRNTRSTHRLRPER